MASRLVFEVGTEEIPATYFPGPLEQLPQLASEFLREARLSFSEAYALGTMRRLVLVVEGLAPRQEDEEREIRGPTRAAAFDGEGNPTPAALGFARAQGVDASSLQVKETSKGAYVFALVRKSGQPALHVLPGVLEKVVRGLTFPKQMRWGYLKFRFVRPIRWVLALLDDEVVPVEFEGLKAWRETQGHRILAPGFHQVKTAQDYEQALERLCVWVHHRSRQAEIERQSQELAGEVAGKPYGPDDLLAVTTFSVEWPTGFLGRFSQEFLPLPEPVLVSVMRKHQQYFAVRDASGHLLPHFVAFRDGGEGALDVVREGNERFLAGRLRDAAFFFKKDREHPLSHHAGRLDRIALPHGMGTMEDKAERLEQLAGHFLSEWWAAEASLDEMKAAAGRAAALCKADLVTLMVTEFPELQGTMGAEYARLDGEHDEVVMAIREQYLPRFAGDQIPSTPLSKALAVADRLDSLCACVGAGLLPTGSEDPYALRRLAQGAVSTLLTVPGASLCSAVEHTCGLLEKSRGLERPLAEVQRGTLELLLARLAFVLEEEKSVRREAVEAVMEVAGDLPMEACSRAAFVEEGLRDGSLVPVAVAGTRVANIVSAAERKGEPCRGPFDETLFETEAERELAAAGRQAQAALENGNDLGRILRALQPLVSPVNRFFDDVFVMGEDTTLRHNRLRLAAFVDDLMRRLADFSKLTL